MSAAATKASLDALTAEIDRLRASDAEWGRLHQQVIEERAAALREVATLKHAHQWRPMETASRDGAPVLVWSGRNMHVAVFDRIENEWVSLFKTVSKRLVVRPEPTHWMPLPPVPNITEGEGK